MFGALVNSLCPLEELDMRGQWYVEKKRQCRMYSKRVDGMILRLEQVGVLLTQPKLECKGLECIFRRCLLFPKSCSFFVPT